MLQDIINHSTPQITLKYIGINKEEKDNILDTFQILKINPAKHKNTISCPFEQLIYIIFVSGSNILIGQYLQIFYMFSDICGYFGRIINLKKDILIFFMTF